MHKPGSWLRTLGDGDEDVAGGGLVEFDWFGADADTDPAAGAAEWHLCVWPEPCAVAQLGQQGGVGLDGLGDAAHGHVAGLGWRFGQRDHLGERFGGVLVTELGQSGDWVAVGRVGRVAQDVEHPALHGLADHVLSPACFLVDQVPVKAQDIGEHAFSDPVLAHHAYRR
jgi:hypothetical protein